MLVTFNKMEYLEYAHKLANQLIENGIPRECFKEIVSTLVNNKYIRSAYDSAAINYLKSIGLTDSNELVEQLNKDMV